MIITKTILIKKTEDLSSEYIESNLKELGFDVLRWAIVDIQDDNYVLSIAVLE